jgi:hypothetical protein
MPVTKITLSTAMRARDVSRPRAEQLADATDREDTVARQPDQPDEAAPRVPAAAPPSAKDEPATPRRRRRRRS